MIFASRQRQTALLTAACLLVLTDGCSKKPESATPAKPETAAAKPEAAGSPATPEMVLPAPYGHHTDDLDAMLKRRYLRALVLINPIGFFYTSNGQPMGV